MKHDLLETPLTLRRWTSRDASGRQLVMFRPEVMRLLGAPRARFPWWDPASRIAGVVPPGSAIHPTRGRSVARVGKDPKGAKRASDLGKWLATGVWMVTDMAAHDRHQWSSYRGTKLIARCFLNHVSEVRFL